MKRKIVNEIFIERLSALLEDAKTQKNIALSDIEEAIGVSKGSISKYRSGIHVPNSEIVRALANYFNVSMDYLCGDSDKKKSIYEDNGYSEYMKVAEEAAGYGVTPEQLHEILNLAVKMKKVSE